MPTPGYVFRDSGTTPLAEEESTTGSRQLGHEESQSPASPQSSVRSRKSPVKSNASASHAIAVADHDVKGAAQKAGSSPDITDLGWRSHYKDVDNLVGKLPNEELWTLIRRFNRVRTNPSVQQSANASSKHIMSKPSRPLKAVLTSILRMKMNSRPINFEPVLKDYT